VFCSAAPGTGINSDGISKLKIAFISKVGCWVGLLINLYSLVLKLMGENIRGRPLLLLGMMLLFGGIQFITIGIVVEIQMRMYFEPQQKKTYKVSRVKGKRFQGSEGRGSYPALRLRSVTRYDPRPSEP
jgi:hypothetical protein